MVFKENTMSSDRKHPRCSRAGIAGGAIASPCDEFAAADTPCTHPGDLIDRTVAIWRERAQRELTREDGREIIENITGFFSILQEWDRRERAAEARSTAPLPHYKLDRRKRGCAYESSLDQKKAKKQA
jgi:hypothetical protein